MITNSICLLLYVQVRLACSAAAPPEYLFSSGEWTADDEKQKLVLMSDLSISPVSLCRNHFKVDYNNYLILTFSPCLVL